MPIIVSLVFSNVMVGFPQLVASLLLIEIGLSFDVSVGVAGQIKTIAFVILILLFLNVPSIWLSVILWYLAGLMCSFRDQAYTSLVLDQIPAYRGTMMSLSSLTNNLALALGTSLGGLILVSYDYALLGSFGFLIVLGAFIFQFFSVEATG